MKQRIYKGWEMNVVYLFGQILIFDLLDLMFDVEYIGLNNIPREGGFLLASNHVSYLDPFLVICGIKRNTYSFARKTLFRNKVGRFVLEKLLAIPVDRDSDGDVGSIKRVFEVLKAGSGLLLFPEGRRSDDGELKVGKKGVGYMACKAQVPVVPVRVFGGYEAWSRKQKWPRIGSKITVVYGEALWPEEYDGRESVVGERYQRVADKIMREIGRIEKPEGY